MPESPMRYLPVRTIIIAIVITFLEILARAGTNTDNFNISRNYLTNGVAGTIWEGLYPGGTSDIPNMTGIGTAAGSASLINANTTSASNLTVQAVHTDW